MRRQRTPDESPDSKELLLLLKLHLLLWTMVEPGFRDELILIWFLFCFGLFAVLSGFILLQSWKAFIAGIKEARRDQRRFDHSLHSL